MMKKVLIVDDSKTILTMLQIEFDELDNDIDTIYAGSYKEAQRIIREHQGHIHAALLDVNLPDAPNGEIISLAALQKIPTVVLTGTMNDSVKKIIEKNDVISYVVKGTPKSTGHAIKIIQKILRNYDRTVMIVDNSKLSQKVLVDALNKIRVNILVVDNGEEALEKLKDPNQNISIVFTSNEMSVMSGIELTIKIRELYDKDQISIIALGSTDKADVINNFLKYGANDFINKPFTDDEVIVRTNSNLDTLDLFTNVSDMANKDFLTGAFNRRYFFDFGEKIFLKAKRESASLAVAMIDIDNFKNINDTYGHDVGDIAIKEIKKILDLNLRESDLMARFGGEEFCILLDNITKEDAEKLFNRIRKNFEDNVVDAGDVQIKYTVSFGVAYGLNSSLEDMVKLSDNALYDSKENGRNKVTMIEI